MQRDETKVSPRRRNFATRWNTHVRTSPDCVAPLWSPSGYFRRADGKRGRYRRVTTTARTVSSSRIDRPTRVTRCNRPRDGKFINIQKVGRRVSTARGIFLLHFCLFSFFFFFFQPSGRTAWPRRTLVETTSHDVIPGELWEMNYREEGWREKGTKVGKMVSCKECQLHFCLCFQRCFFFFSFFFLFPGAEKFSCYFSGYCFSVKEKLSVSSIVAWDELIWTRERERERVKIWRNSG